jgi:hypothetical protein
MAKIKKKIKRSELANLDLKNNSHITVLSQIDFCGLESIIEEVEIDDNWFTEGCNNLRNHLNNIDFHEKSLGLNQNTLFPIPIRSGFFRTADLTEMISKATGGYIRLYMAVQENRQFIFLAPLDDTFKVVDDVTILCTKKPPCTSLVNDPPIDEIEDKFYRK